MIRVAIWLRLSSIESLEGSAIGLGEAVINVCLLGVDAHGTDVALLGLRGTMSRFLGVCLAYVMYMASDRKYSADGWGPRTVLKASRKRSKV